jgi:hypothetical protein
MPNKNTVKNSLVVVTPPYTDKKTDDREQDFTSDKKFRLIICLCEAHYQGWSDPPRCHIEHRWYVHMEVKPGANQGHLAQEDL